MRRLVCVLPIFGLLSIAVTLAQQAPKPTQDQGATNQPPTFRSEVNYVEVNAVVTDAQGNWVSGLQKEDFEIYEDGKLRTPTVFGFVDLPITPPAVNALRGRAVESDVRSAARPFDGRLYVLVLDDLHTEGLRSQLVQQAARRFIEQYLGDGDVAAVVHTSGAGAGTQELTSSRPRLWAAIDKFRGQKIESAASGRLTEFRREQSQLSPDTAATTGAMQESDRDRRLRTQDPNDVERGYNARRSLEVLRDVAGWMADIRGRRKSLLFIGEGIDYNIHDIFTSTAATGLIYDIREAIGAAARSNVSIYTVDPRGLAGINGEMIEIADLPSGGQQNQLGTLAFSQDLRLAQDSLRVLADETGGLALVNMNDLTGGFERIVRDASTYYVLGYYADPDARGGRFHKIEVRVRRPGLQVRARRGYVTPDPKATAREAAAAAKGGLSPALREALSNPVSGGTLPMSLFAAPFKSDEKNASVLFAVEVDGRQLKFTEKDGRFLDDVEFSLLATDYAGKTQSKSQTLSLQLRPETHKYVSQFGVRLLSRVNLPPARYQVRVAAHDTGGNAVGVIHYDLDVPNYAELPLAISGVLLTSGAAGSVMTSNVDAQLKEMLPGPPTAARTFLPEDMLVGFAEIYDNTAPSKHLVDVTTTVQSADGRNVFTSKDELASESSRNARTHGYKFEIPLKGLAPGEFVLRVEVRSRAGNAGAIARDIPFRVAN